MAAGRWARTARPPPAAGAGCSAAPGAARPPERESACKWSRGQLAYPPQLWHLPQAGASQSGTVCPHITHQALEQRSSHTVAFRSSDTDSLRPSRHRQDAPPNGPRRRLQGFNGVGTFLGVAVRPVEAICSERRSDTCRSPSWRLTGALAGARRPGPVLRPPSL